MGDEQTHRATRWLGLAAMAGAVALAALVGLGGREGVVLADSTDHLRHMGEAAAWADVGWGLYRAPYAEVLASHPPPCPAHRGLWEDEPTVVPPLAVLLHWPLAAVEARGWWAPAVAHAAQGAGLAALGGFALVVALWLARRDSALAFAVHAGTTAPLLVATSLAAFVDTAFVLAAVGGLWALRARRPAAAVLGFALAGALHVRAGVFLVPAGVALVQVLRARSPLRWPALLVAAGLVLPALVATSLMVGRVHFEAANPAHWTHFRHARLWELLGLAAVCVVGLWRVGEREAAGTVPLATLLAVLDPHHAYWHAFVLLGPALVLLGAPRTERRWPSWAWVALFAVVGAGRLYLFPLTPYWQWVRFAFVGGA